VARGHRDLARRLKRRRVAQLLATPRLSVEQVLAKVKPFLDKDVRSVKTVAADERIDLGALGEMTNDYFAAGS